jgi:hypothetical protein
LLLPLPIFAFTSSMKTHSFTTIPLESFPRPRYWILRKSAVEIWQDPYRIFDFEVAGHAGWHEPREAATGEQKQKLTGHAARVLESLAFRPTASSWPPGAEVRTRLIGSRA